MYEKVLKRIFDICLSLIGMIFFVFIYAFSFVMIKTEDGGPIFYSGERFGQNGRIFKMHKLRTMSVNAPDIRQADGSTFNSKDDPRVTKFGRFARKTSIDELAQLINILKGDMSFIGPRPLLADRPYSDLSDDVKEILKKRPGVTGYSQAYYRNSINQVQKMENDLYYVRNISFPMDCKISIHTFISVIDQKDIIIQIVNKKR